MSIDFEKIAHHQRILITGPRAEEILEQAGKILTSHHREYDVVTAANHQTTHAPVVLIIHEDFGVVDPHIVLMDEIQEKDKSRYEKMADNMPKSGTLVYNTGNATAKAICEKDRTDVHKVPFSGDTESATRALLKRMGIHETDFDQATQ